jgi:hypothetical protein
VVAHCLQKLCVVFSINVPELGKGSCWLKLGKREKDGGEIGAKERAGVVGGRQTTKTSSCWHMRSTIDELEIEDGCRRVADIVETFVCMYIDTHISMSKLGAKPWIMRRKELISPIFTPALISSYTQKSHRGPRIERGITDLIENRILVERFSKHSLHCLDLYTSFLKMSITT